MTYFNVIKYCNKFKHVVTLHEEKKKQLTKCAYYIFDFQNN